MYAVNLSSTLGSASPFFISESSADSYSDSNSDPSSSDFLNSAPFNADDSNDQLADKITTLAGQINAATYRFLKMIAEFDRRKAWEGAGIRSCAYWLAWKSGLDITVAREKVRVAKALVGLPKTNAAFEKGELSYSKVRAMTRVATVENESFLLNIAQYGTTQHVEKLVGAFRSVNDSVVIDEVKQDRKVEQTLYESRGVSCYQDDEGMWIIKAKLPAEEGALVVKVLKELGDRLAANDNAVGTLDVNKSDDEKSDDEKSDEEKTKNVSAETFSSYKNNDLEKDKLLKEPLTFPQRRADALVMMVEGFVSQSGEALGLKGHERCQLVLHVQKDANSRHDLDGRWLLPDAARRLACDASLLVVEKDEVGNVLDIGRRSRIIPAGMARALAIRDGGCCQFPGCCESRYVEGHHVKHWADGGETKLDNLVTLCRYHHRELHRGKFFLAVKPLSVKQASRFADRLCFSTVRSSFMNKPQQVIAQNPAKFLGAGELKQALPRAIYEGIGANTAVTKWLGERMDLGMAVEGLLSVSRIRPTIGS
jgi:hypothetical protein